MNEFVPLGPIFSDHILPDLQSPIDSVHPIIKVDVIKYVLLFRSIVINNNEFYSKYKNSYQISRPLSPY